MPRFTCSYLPPNHALAHAAAATSVHATLDLDLLGEFGYSGNEAEKGDDAAGGLNCPITHRSLLLMVAILGVHNKS
jgi:hypothetical protein